MHKNLYLMIFVYQSWYKNIAPKLPLHQQQDNSRSYLFLPIDMRYMINSKQINQKDSNPKPRLSYAQSHK